MTTPFSQAMLGMVRSRSSTFRWAALTANGDEDVVSPFRGEDRRLGFQGRQDEQDSQDDPWTRGIRTHQTSCPSCHPVENRFMTGFA